MSCANEQGFGPLHLLAQLATTAGAFYELRARDTQQRGRRKSSFVVLFSKFVVFFFVVLDCFVHGRS